MGKKTRECFFVWLSYVYPTINDFLQQKKILYEKFLIIVYAESWVLVIFKIETINQSVYLSL